MQHEPTLLVRWPEGQPRYRVKPSAASARTVLGLVQGKNSGSLKSYYNISMLEKTLAETEPAIPLFVGVRGHIRKHRNFRG